MSNKKEPGFITCNNGAYVVVFDKSDTAKVTKYRWRVNAAGYVQCRSNDKEFLFMHQLILGFRGNGKTSPDHINRVKTDNRRCNLRIVSQAENIRNRKLPIKKSMPLTEKELVFLSACEDYMDINKVFPTYRWLMDALNYKSPNSVHQYIKSLIKKGAIAPDDKLKYKVLLKI